MWITSEDIQVDRELVRLLEYREGVQKNIDGYDWEVTKAVRNLLVIEKVSVNNTISRLLRQHKIVLTEV